MFTMEASTNASGLSKTEKRTPLINARSAAWALSSVTVVSLVVGLAAVEYFGSFTRTPVREQNPEVLTSRPVTPDAERPTVLLPMHNLQGSSVESLGGFDSLFAAPGRDPIETTLAPRPSGGAAALPPTRRFD